MSGVSETKACLCSLSHWHSKPNKGPCPRRLRAGGPERGRVGGRTPTVTPPTWGPHRPGHRPLHKVPKVSSGEPSGEAQTPATGLLPTDSGRSQGLGAAHAASGRSRVPGHGAERHRSGGREYSLAPPGPAPGMDGQTWHSDPVSQPRRPGPPGGLSPERPQPAGASGCSAASDLSPAAVGGGECGRGGMGVRTPCSPPWGSAGPHPLPAGATWHRAPGKASPSGSPMPSPRPAGRTPPGLREQWTAQSPRWAGPAPAARSAAAMGPTPSSGDQRPPLAPHCLLLPPWRKPGFLLANQLHSLLR